MSIKLYYHKTSEGAEYLFDTFTVCPNGHKEGHIDSFFLKDLGLNKIDMLDHNTNLMTYNLNDRIILSVPEFDGFRRSLLLVGQVWRTWNV